MIKTYCDHCGKELPDHPGFAFGVEQHKIQLTRDGLATDLIKSEKQFCVPRCSKIIEQKIKEAWNYKKL